MVFAAGLGTRLRPLTDTIPKALVPVAGVPLLQRVLLNLKRYGFHEIVINVHHLHDQITGFLQQQENFGLDLHISNESEKLLDTGGGLKKAAQWLAGKESFLLCNVDILSDLDLGEFMEFHRKSASLATLAVRNRDTSRFFLFDESMNLCGWKNESTGETILSRPSDSAKKFAFSGIHAVHPDLLPRLLEEEVFSINQVYLELSKKYPIKGFVHDQSFWFDIGRQESLLKANQFFSEK